MSEARADAAARRGACTVDPTPVALEVLEVSKTFYPPTHWFRRPRAGDPRVRRALHGVSFRVREGEMIGLLGPNGAGKTTLSKIIATLIHPSSGEVRLWGEDVRRDPYAARARMGLVTCDERSFYWRLTGRQNLAFFGALQGLSKAQIEERSAELLANLGLTAATDAPYHTYSSGMKQKLAIARGLLARPRLVLYDEPTRSLDPLSAHNIREWIAERRRVDPRQTHLIATNQLGEAERLCDRVLVINGGRLVAQGTVEEIRARWDPRSVDGHRIEVLGLRYEPPRERIDDPAVVRISVEVEETGRGSTVHLMTRRGGTALSAVLGDILARGGTIAACATEETSFDEVFCSLIEAGDGPAPRREAEAEAAEA